MMAVGGAATLALAGCGNGAGSTGTAVTGAIATTTTPATTQTAPGTIPAPDARRGLEVRVRPEHRQPVAGRAYPITVTATRDGRPVSGTIEYGFVFAGSVVARRSHYHFDNGRFTDDLQFPKRATGIPLTLRVFVTTDDGGKAHADLPVRVRPAGG